MPQTACLKTEIAVKEMQPNKTQKGLKWGVEQKIQGENELLTTLQLLGL